jgi:RHS repeat-associated protein
LITNYEGEEYERLEYTPYGELWIEKAAEASALDIAYRFTGKERDEETGNYYYGARYLDPRTGRWLSTDPAVGDYVPGAGAGPDKLPGMGGVFNPINFHMYHYAGNNPVKYVDPDGKFAIPIILVAGGIAAVATLAAIPLFKSLERVAQKGLAAISKPSPTYSNEAKQDDEATQAGERIQDNAQAAAPAPSQPPQNNNDKNNSNNDNQFKGKTPEEIDKEFRDKGYTPKGEDPANGKGSYIDESNGTKYYIDKGGRYRVPGRGIVNEPPHVDVERPNLPKERHEL